MYDSGSFDTDSFDINSFYFDDQPADSQAARLRQFIADGLQNDPKTVVDPSMANKQQLAAKRKQMLMAQMLQRMGQQPGMY